jgi:hypothetical protein
MGRWCLTLILIPLGIIVGALSSIVGFGGGFLIVPSLILIFNLKINYIVGISLFAITATAISATLGYFKQKRIDYKLGLFYNILDFPGVILGAWLTTIIPHKILTAFCGFLVMVISFLLLKNKISENGKLHNGGWLENKFVDSSGKIFRYSLKSPFLALLSSFLGGLVTGLAGLGGGITDTSTMILLGVPPHVAVATSEFAMAMSNLVGALSHGFLENILFEYAIPLAIGTFLGAQIGCKIASKINKKILTKIIAFVAFSIGLKSFLTGIL